MKHRKSTSTHFDTAEDSRRLEPPEVLRRLTGANAQFVEEVCWVTFDW